MKSYIVILIESGEKTIVARYNSLEAAKKHLRRMKYYPKYRRSEEALDIDPDGMSGSGYDETGYFTYTIKTEVA